MAAVASMIIKKGTEKLIDLQTGRSVSELKWIMVETAATVDAGDTFTVNLTQFGGTTLLGILGFRHDTDNSVITVENQTTTVASSVVTCTVIAGADNLKRIAKIFYE